MKKLILGLLLLAFISTGHSQILLEETKIDYKKESMKIDPNLNMLTITIPEKAVGEFQNDPLIFVRKQFDIQKLIQDNKQEKFIAYDVNFKTRKGYLVAHFDRQGELVSSFQKFKNVELPQEVRLQILQKYRDAVVIKNTYLASSRGWDLEKETYRVKVKDGDKTRRLQIQIDQNGLVLAGL